MGIMGDGLFWIRKISIPDWVACVIALSSIGTAYIFWRIIRD